MNLVIYQFLAKLFSLKLTNFLKKFPIYTKHFKELLEFLFIIPYFSLKFYIPSGICKGNLVIFIFF
jgi:hypothetical protein